MTDLVVLLDVDNTLLDNDRVREELERDLAGVLGKGNAARFWEIYEEVREETDLVNFPLTLERFARECGDAACLGQVGAALYHFPFGSHLYPDGLRAIRHLASFATPVILSDGDQLFQRYKIRVAGLEAAVGGNVLVYVHKEQRTEEIRRLFPARHYAMVDDKARIHAAMKAAMGDEITTIIVCQGKYAQDPAHHDYPDADVTIESIGALLALGLEDLMYRAGHGGGR